MTTGWGWANIGPGSTYYNGYAGTEPTAYGTQSGGSCAGYSTNIAQSSYAFSIPSAGDYDVLITWGIHSSYVKKSYVFWNAEATTSSYLSPQETIDSSCTASACDTEQELTLTYRATLSAGSQILYVGAASDGWYYTIPCTVTDVDQTHGLALPLPLCRFRWCSGVFNPAPRQGAKSA